ncbi:MAG: thiosulfate oxidation carrier complex protein SoxZ [Magnetococcales bacterium]|nr:thiosulfate oxidation carrier complex protein SoxZ [Magnetococcales bacterium]NGZ25967.1 thiosulfate oxidation carrier complex protein SoxZ [Magnetococcales bacterium]
MSDIGSPKVKGPAGPVKKGDMVEFKTLLKHPMESGLRKNKDTGETIPAHHVSEVTVNYNGKDVIKSTWSGGVSANPYYAFFLKAEASGPVKVTWKDNKGESFSAEAKLDVQ